MKARALARIPVAGRARLDIHESRRVDSGYSAAVDARCTPERPRGSVEVVVIDRAENQVQLVEAAGPVLAVVHVVCLHDIKIFELGGQRHPISSLINAVCGW
ncbi:hypothetical protein [Actinoplanes lobatus]|uniref:Uncharacterized protein n=1 Tax=Actinoplanes lobatus TaxID=113568 RepID=A0A7W7HKZ7_9ACTN|nr:hypothetical protein [Actinoplanes lobatus]MBB4752380.1 hypothetical protein [Actinoplanes lobatus]